MKKPYNYKKEYMEILEKSGFHRIKNEDKAQKRFNAQVDSIKGIKWTTWLQEIKNFWIREIIDAQESIIENTKNIEDYWKNTYWDAIKMKMATRFLNFIENIENYESIIEDKN